jgi:hypothetical protein
MEVDNIDFSILSVAFCLQQSCIVKSHTHTSVKR